MDFQDAADRLVTEVPEFRATYDRHRATHAKLLPTVLMAEFAAFVERELDRPRPDQGLLTRSFAALEHLWDTFDHRDMEATLGTGFLEHFSPEGLARIRDRLGPGLLSMVEAEERWIADRLARGIGLQPGDWRT
jgi:hypothetical protein